ncbi:hypothetical protein BHUM_04467c [Candidatus Burkholderia humilis]|nr:hypothetical protein BHUM_04467c [Candidatus Burkholderia humilis]
MLQDGSILVADRENNRVERFSPDGERLGTFCWTYHPTEICQSVTGTIYVTDLTLRISAMRATAQCWGVAERLVRLDTTYVRVRKATSTLPT